MIEIDLIQGDPKWHEWRDGMITASIAPIIMGDSPYRTKLQLWRERMKMDPPQAQNAAMRRGNDLEPQIRQYASEVFGREFIPKVFQSSKYEWLGCSVDGIADGEIIIEIKTCGKEDFDACANFGRIPKKYKAQLQTIMEVCEIDRITYIANHDGKNAFAEVNRDQTYINQMIPKLKEFWDSLQNFDMPEGKYIINEDEEWKRLATEWNFVKDAQKELSIQEESLRSALLSMSGGRNMAGSGLKVSGIQRKGSINYSGIAELQGVDLEKYRSPATTIWRIENE